MGSKKKIKKAYKELAVFFGILYMIVIFVYIHYSFAKAEYPGSDNLFSLTLQDIIDHPFAIWPLPEGTLSTILIITFAVIVFMFLGFEYSKNRQHYNSETIQGDAKWLDDKALIKYTQENTEPYGQPGHDGVNNIIFSEEIFLGMDTRKTERNLNVLAIGGSGSGKSYRLVGPNLLQCNCSYIITDPSGDLFAEYGNFFEYMGYTVKCLNLVHMEKSNHYNPFDYINSYKDVEVLVTTLIDNTTPPEKSGGDPFWDKSEQALLVAIISLLWHFKPKSQQNFSEVMNMLRMAQVDESGSKSSTNMQSSFGDSPLDKEFDKAREIEKDSFPVKQYHTFKQGAGKTLKSILISCSVRLQAFDLSDVKGLTDTDDIALEAVGDEKTALFIMLPTGERTFNFLASMMYSQMFQILYEYAENSAHFGTLLMDANNQVVRTFRAADLNDADRARGDAEALFERVKCTGKIIENPKFESEVAGKKIEWWEIRTNEPDDGIIAHRGTRREAENALAAIKNGKLISNSKQSNNGKRMPIHVRMMLDEFANIGKIPDFQTKISTIRKYEISTTIIVQTIDQLKEMYKDTWGSISGNCDTAIYLGGGLDPETAKWLADALGKETRRGMNTSYQGGGGGSTSFNLEGVDLLSAAQIRTIPGNECIVLPKSLSAYKGPKFNTENHKNRKLQTSLPRYYFDGEKAALIYKEYEKRTRTDNSAIKHGEVTKVTKEDDAVIKQKNTENEKRAEQYINNKDIDGKKIVEDPEELSDEEMNKNLGISKDTAEQVEKELEELNDDLWLDDFELIVSSAPRDN